MFTMIDDEPCAKCSAAILEAPSAIAALVNLVVTGAHRQHILDSDDDQLPF